MHDTTQVPVVAVGESGTSVGKDLGSGGVARVIVLGFGPWGL